MRPSLLELLSHGVFPYRIPDFGPLTFMVLPIPLFFLWRRGKSAGYLLCFSIFFIYAWKVVVITILDELPWDLQDLVFIQRRHFWGWINLVPSFLSGEFDPRSVQVYGNFLLGVPFGFGLPFLAYTTHKRAIVLGFGLGLGLELAQLLIGLVVFHGPYRTIDIDDVWLVFAGTLAGYGALWAAARVYQRIGWAGGARLPVWDHIHSVLLGVASPEGRSRRRE